MTTDQQRLSAIQAELLHCPFCGSDNLKSVMETSSASFEILCEQCATTGPACRNEVDAGRFWNTRAQLSTPKPEALSREGGEFDEAAECVRFEASYPERLPYWWKRLESGKYDYWVEKEWRAWLASARIAHTEITEARKRIAELEAHSAEGRRSVIALINHLQGTRSLELIGISAEEAQYALLVWANAPDRRFDRPIAEEKADG